MARGAPEVTTHTFPAQPLHTANREIIARFTEYLRVEKGLSPLTIEAYESDLLQLSEFLGHRQLIRARRQDLSSDVGQLWVQHQRRHKLSSSETCSASNFRYPRPGELF